MSLESINKKFQEIFKDFNVGVKDKEPFISEKKKEKKTICITYFTHSDKYILFPVHKAFSSVQKAIKHLQECDKCDSFQELSLE